MMLAGHVSAMGVQRHKEKSILRENELELQHDNSFEANSSFYKKADGGPSKDVALRLKHIKQRASMQIPDSPHKVSEVHGNEFDIFLMFKGRTKLVRWERWNTMISLQEAFFEAYHFPERMLHPFLLNKARLEVVVGDLSARKREASAII